MTPEPPGTPEKPMTSDSIIKAEGIEQLKQKTKGGFMRVKSDLKKINDAHATNFVDLSKRIQKNTDDMTSMTESIDALK